MLRWAAERSGITPETLQARLPRLVDWEKGRAHPTLRNLEVFARVTHVSFGTFFLQKPPEEYLPIPDLRRGRAAGNQPSPNLLEAIHLCQLRQDWYREHLQRNKARPLPFVGSASLEQPPERTAQEIARTIGLNVEERRRIPTWTEALRRFREQVQGVGVLVMASGIVGNNTRRKLDPDEFRGFALVDSYAPLVFINSADSRSAQMFTLAHELAHVWLGQSALSNPDLQPQPLDTVECWCDEAAAELLVPREQLLDSKPSTEDPLHAAQELAKTFKVSTLVCLRRLYDTGLLPRAAFQRAFGEEIARLRRLETKGKGGGDFFNTLQTRVGAPFARALLTSALEGTTLYTEAFRLLGIRKMSTLRQLARKYHLD